jgi:hypothetical protein
LAAQAKRTGYGFETCRDIDSLLKRFKLKPIE